MKVLVALSGGVDSSVVAHLMKEQGHEVIGVMMKIWSDPLAPAVRRALPTKCCSIEHIQRARSVCETLKIPFYVLDMEQEFKQKVVDPFLAAYQNAETPNPCIECNRQIKFGALLKKMEELGCDALATGHYARIATEQLSDGTNRHILQEALDEAKDQSYYLYTLDQEKLPKILFPLGSLRKNDVFSLARKFDVPIPESYRESQDLCFFPEREPTAFLKRYLPATNAGEIKMEDGTVVSSHKGLPYYTIGQRRGLRIGGLKIPLYVSRKERATNTLFVAPDGADRKSNLRAMNIHWVSWMPPENQEIPLEARIRSLGEKRRGVLRHTGSRAEFSFESPLRGIAAGQSLVLYRGMEVVGGGKIVN